MLNIDGEREVAAALQWYEGLSHDELAPLLDALSDQFVDVQSSRLRLSFPMTQGGPEYVALLRFVLESSGEAIVGAAVLRIAAMVLTPAWVQVRSRLREMINLARRKPVGRHPLAIELGPALFHFDSDGEMDQVTFDAQLQAMTAYVQSLPVLEPPASGEHSGLLVLYWDEETRSWFMSPPLIS
jgi:hypothetical protein